MGAASIPQMAGRIGALMETRLRIRGHGLAAKLARGGRRLPRAVRAAATRLAAAEAMAGNPRLLVQIDEARVAEDFDLCLRHLSGLDRQARRRAALSEIALSILTGLVVLAVLVWAVLRWRGFV